MLSRLSPKEQKQVALIAAAAFLLRALLGLRSNFLIATGPYIDDGFYAFSCAMQMARGHGFTVDGVHATNGVQPLICILYAPFFYFADDKWLALRYTFILQGIIIAVGCYLIAKFVASLRGEENDRSPVIAAGIWGLSISCFYQNTNGLETGLTALLLIACLLVSSSRLDSQKNSLIFGAVLGLTVLARIDSAILVAIFALFDLMRSRFKATVRIVTYSFAALLVSSPWWVYNVTAFHSLMPMSGQSESLSRPYATNIVWLLNALIDQLSIFYIHLYRSWDRQLTAIAVLALVTGWIALYRVRIAPSKFKYKSLIPFALFCAALIIYYTLFFSAPYFIDRYLTPLRLLLVILFAERVSAFLWTSTTSLRVIQLAGLGIAVFCTIQFYNQFSRPTLWEDFYSVGEWARAQPGKVGMFQSGLTGFMAPNVINLDGKVSADALRARKENRLAEYVIRNQCQYIADWPDDVRPLVAQAASLGVQFDSVRWVGSVCIYERR